MNHSQTMSDILVRAAQAKVAELTEQLLIYTKSQVQAGPFKGMILPDSASWGSGDVCPKLLGTYEQELHVSIETCIARKPDIVVNVGCAEGYYAVGMAMRLPDAKITAYDKDPKAAQICSNASAKNGVGFIAGGFECHAVDLSIVAHNAKREGQRVLIIMDAEGAELELVTRQLDNCDLIIECHDFKDRSITPKLLEILEPWHDVKIIHEGPRDPSGIPLLAKLNTLERYCAVCEFRPGPIMNWIVALAKGR